MISLTEKERAVMAQNVAYILSICGSDANPKEVMSRAYREFMQDKTESQGDLMAQQLLDTMEDYIVAEELAGADAGLLAAYQLDRLLEGRPLQQQCQILHSFLQGLQRFDRAFVRYLSGVGTYGKTLDPEKAEAVPGSYDGPVTEEARDMLRTRAVQTVAHASLSDETLEALEKCMEKGGIDDRQVLQGRSGDYLFQAASAMVIYCMAKNGQLSCVPREITLEQVVLIVCAEESMRQLMGNLSKGYITMDQYKRRMTASWNAKKLLLVSVFAVLGIAAAAASVMNCRYDLAILAAAAAIHGIFICLFPMDRLMKEMITQEAVGLFQVDTSVTDHTVQIMKKYRNYADALVQTPANTPWQQDEDPVHVVQKRYIPLGRV